MAFETPITIKSAVDNIYSRKYLLPAIQREFVWSTEQIEILFDSLMRDYPIGSFLFWYVEKEHTKDYEFYEFITAYSEFNARHNPKANISGQDDVITVLDGQQRLTALYIGLKGSYAYKMARKRFDNPQSYPVRKLYLNLRDSSKDDNREYDFRFLTSEEAKDKNNNYFWFEVGKILDFDEAMVNEYLVDNDLMAGSGSDKSRSKFANRTLFKLHTMVHKNLVINYYLEKSTELDKVLNVFIRINNGGTKLNYTDLLLSIATAQWKEKDAREEINRLVDELNSIGDGFKFDKDMILRSCLLLADINNIAFKVDNFKKDNMLLIEKKWDDIAAALRKAVELVASYGYNRDTLTSHSSISIIAYYILKNDIPNTFVSASRYEQDRKYIKQWLVKSLLKKVFSAHPENLFRTIREIILSNEQMQEFPLKEIIEKVKGSEKSLTFNQDDIDNLLEYEYGQAYTFSTLSILYPTLDYRNKIHIDHIYPKSLFKRNVLIKSGVPISEIEYYMEQYNSLANLQLMEGIVNQEKSNTPFEEWINSRFDNTEERHKYMLQNYIPENIDYDIKNFRQFIEERKRLLRSQFTKLL